MTVSPPCDLQGLFSGFAAYLGLDLVEYGQAQTVIALQVNPEHLNQAGNLHGGVIAAMADAALGMCGTWNIDPDLWRLSLTLSLNINYMAPAPAGSRVRVIARVRGGGPKIYMAACDVLDAEDSLLASAEGVFKRSRLRRLPA
ncbi:PaaI family thioesterase [Pseudomonas brenneri]|uniref:PaaI family thioesterase n=1 Tax=Pseudomonas brenneri TaxID=129817 RepID=UPI0028D1B0EC|nr:PaaI family thioesterase [Pseudomonas brenneri]